MNGVRFVAFGAVRVRRVLQARRRRQPLLLVERRQQLRHLDARLGLLPVIQFGLDLLDLGEAPVAGLDVVVRLPADAAGTPEAPGSHQMQCSGFVIIFSVDVWNR